MKKNTNNKIYIYIFKRLDRYQKKKSSLNNKILRIYILIPKQESTIKEQFEIIIIHKFQ